MKNKRTRNSSLSYQIVERAREMDTLREKKNRSETTFKVGSADKKIHSYSTNKNYMKTMNLFVEFAKESGAKNRDNLDDVLEKYGSKFLDDLVEKGRAGNTVQSYRSALNKYSRNDLVIDVKNTEVPVIKDTEISNNNTPYEETISSKHFSEENNRNLINMVIGTGARRCGFDNLKKSDFFYENDVMYVNLLEKHGKERTAPVLKEYQEDIEKFLTTKRDDELVFSRVHKHAPMHRMRALYSKKLYSEVIQDKMLYDRLKEKYPERKSFAYESKIKSDMYYSKNTDFEGKRDDIYLVSQALGHNRLEVVVTRYMAKRDNLLPFE